MICLFADYFESEHKELCGGKEQLESLGLMMSLERLTRGEISTEEFNDLYGHRSANELEFAAKRSAEDENWIETMKSHLLCNSTNTADLLREQERKRHKIWSDLVVKHPRKAKKLKRAFDKCADLARRREQIRSSLVRYVWLERTWVQTAGSLCG